MSYPEQAIRERAYHLWIVDGCQDGAADSYWLAAQREILSELVTGSDIGTSAMTTAAAASPKKTPSKAKAAKVDKKASPAKSKRRAA